MLCCAAYAPRDADGGGIGSRDMPDSFGCSERRRSAMAGARRGPSEKRGAVTGRAVLDQVTVPLISLSLFAS
jgi:hypothetical protein